MRHLFFILWYGQWFRSHEGVRKFGEQCMNWLLRSTLNLAARLKKQNKQLSEKIKEMSDELTKREVDPVINGDEFPKIQSKIWRYSVSKIIFVVADFFFNFFAAKSIITGEGWYALAGQLFLSVMMTYGFILLFEELCEELLYLKPYKAEHTEGRKWGKLTFLLIIGIAYQLGVFYLCQVRGIMIEGGNGDGIISSLMLVLGVISPILAGYFDYSKGIFINAYKNTTRIVFLKAKIADKKNTIAQNNQRMETHFKLQCEWNWSYLAELATYKENFNRKHGIPQENLTGYFCESQESFVREAIDRYKREAILHEVATPQLIITLAQKNGHDKAIQDLFTH